MILKFANNWIRIKIFFLVGLVIFSLNEAAESQANSSQSTQLRIFDGSGLIRAQRDVNSKEVDLVVKIVASSNEVIKLYPLDLLVEPMNPVDIDLTYACNKADKKRSCSSFLFKSVPTGSWEVKQSTNELKIVQIISPTK